MSKICAWDFCQAAAQDIKRLAGEYVYKQIGQRVIYVLQIRCSENFELVKYADDDDVLATITLVQKEKEKHGSSKA